MADIALVRFPRLNAVKLSCLFRQYWMSCKDRSVSAPKESDSNADPSQTQNKPLTKVPKGTTTKYATSYGRAVSPFEFELNANFGTVWKKDRANNFRKVACLANNEIAEIVANHLQEDVENGRCILEANPGFGYLSHRLIDRGCRQLHLYADKHSLFWPTLETLAAQHSKIVKLVRENILDLRRMIISDMLMDSSREKSCLEGVPREANWLAPAKVTLFAALNQMTETGFLRSLVYMVPYRTGLFSLGRVELLVFVSSKEYATMTAAGQNRPLRPYNILYSLMFELEHIITVNSKNVFPTRSSASHDKELHLVRLRPRQELSDMLTTPGHFEEFVFFMQQGLARGASASQSIDMWVPHAYRNVFVEMTKPNSLLRNVYFSDKLSTLSPEQIVALFRVLRNHDMFEHSLFRAAMDKMRYEPSIINDLAQIAVSAESK